MVSLSLYAKENPLHRCDKCHSGFSAPPYQKVYSKYILHHGSKQRVKKAMVDFLEQPSKEKSLMPNVMQRRFNPNEHPQFTPAISKKAVEYLVETQDYIKKF